LVAGVRAGEDLGEVQDADAGERASHAVVVPGSVTRSDLDRAGSG
jgi:hypothetical protein